MSVTVRYTIENADPDNQGEVNPAWVLALNEIRELAAESRRRRTEKQKQSESQPDTDLATTSQI